MTDENQKQSAPKAANRNRGRRPAKRARAFGKHAFVENSSELHQGRVLAMQALYEMDSADHDIDDIVERLRWDDSGVPESARETPDEDEREIDEIPSDVAGHAERLVRGAIANMETIDPIMAAAAPAFPIAQIAAVDRNVLRLAIYELYHEGQVPVPVAINEAVEIAKRYGGPSSSRFVNGVLGTISKQLPAERHKR